MKPFRYSTISDSHKCMRLYELKHILGMDDGLDKAGELKFGTAIHLGVQDLFEGGDGLHVFSTLWEMSRDSGLQYSVYNRMSHDDHLRLGQSLLEIFRDEHMKKFVPQHLERKMSGTVGRHAFGGTADFIGTYKGMPSLVDWKTAGQPYDNLKLIYNEQIYGYVALAQQDLGITLEQGVYGVAVKDIKNPRWQFKTAAVTAEKLAAVLANIEAVCDDLSTRTTFPKNPNNCVIGKRPCPFFNVCYSSGGAKNGEEGEKT